MEKQENSAPDSELMIVRWRSWKYDQRWWPQKFYEWTGEPECETEFWRWLGREWFRRPSKKPLFRGAYG